GPPPLWGPPPAPSSKDGIPVPGRPQRIVNLISSALSLARRKSAPVGDSSRSFSPFAKAPWQSAHPLLRHAARPAFTLSSFCANVAVEQVKAMAAIVTIALPFPPPPFPPPP